jgi:DNA-binding CsgD family transcriptional regulator
MINLNTALADKHSQAILDAIPANIYWKNTKGEYLGCNHYAIECNRSAGLEATSKDSILGKTDHDLFHNTAAEIFRKNDLDVITQRRAITTREDITLSTGQRVVLLSSKSPLLDSKNRIIGVIGNTVDYFVEHKPLHSHESFPKITNRQIDCLYHLVKGMTKKQIATATNLSPRTVEHYLEAVKEKFNCYDRTELISFALKLPVIKQRLLGKYI